MLKRILLLLLVSSLVGLCSYIRRPIPHPNITGAILLHQNDDGEVLEYELAGLADKSGLFYVATTGEVFDLDGSQRLQVTYPSGKSMTFGGFVQK